MYSAPDFPPLIGSEAPLESVLAARDLRYAAQQALLVGGAASLVSFSVLTPGGVKRSPFLDEIFQTGRACLKQMLAERQIVISAEQHLDLKGGESLLLAVGCAADALKPLMIELEHQHPLGRLWDIDIIGGDGKPLSRSRFGLPPRTCLCCGEPAKACARSRRHSLDELQTAMRGHYRRYREIVALGGSMSAALCAEAELTPKPGLVDADNQGPHPDMTLPMFQASAHALAPFLTRCAITGSGFAQQPPDEAVLAAVRPVGLQAEQAMLNATGGANTHKGALFAFGILAAVLGRRIARGERPGWAALSGDIQAVCAGLRQEQGQGDTAGARFYREYGLGGARGEALSGFATVTDVALPAYRQAFAATGNRDHALRYALLKLLAHNRDTNVVKRGGIEALGLLQAKAHEILADTQVFRRPEALCAALKRFDGWCTARNLSTGGSADLLALTIWITLYLNETGVTS